MGTERSGRSSSEETGRRGVRGPEVHGWGGAGSYWGAEGPGRGSLRGRGRCGLGVPMHKGLFPGQGGSRVK